MAEAIPYSVASNLLSKLGECLFAPIGRLFEYVLCYKSYVEELKNGVKNLETAMQRVQSSVDEAVYDGKLIHMDVEDWLTSVKEEIEKVDNLLKRNESAQDACFRGWLPNPMVRHPIGRKVKKMAQVIQGLHKESKNSNFQKVYYENTPIGIVTAAPSARSAQRKEDVMVLPSVGRSVHGKEDVLESRALVIEDVIKTITDNKVCVIGVYGPGGVGKSKLMEDVERRVKEEQLFDVVARTNVSRTPDLKRIQGEIAYALGLNLLNQETAYGRADLLCKRLEENSEKKIIIILDNLWTKLELKEVGIPCEYDNKVRGCKLLLTSRNRRLLYIEMGSDQEFQLSELKHEEACILFERTVRHKVNDPEFKILVNRVVENCGGLPLLILSVAKRLKRGDLPEWRDALTNIEGSDAKSIVELSYNDLEDERIKALFLVHALFSWGLGIRDAVIYCMGLGLYKKFSKTIEDARYRLMRDRDHLLDSSLLLHHDGTKLCMHDIFIDVAISMHDKFIDTEWNALVGRKDFELKEWSKHDLKKCTAMSSFAGYIHELPEKLDCPNMRILLLGQYNHSLKVPDSFFEHMEKLQVLDLTSLSFTSLPSSMESLENLTTLCLDLCHLKDVTALGKLKGLQFLSFFESTIARLPKEMGELTELRFLDLTRCSTLKVIEPGVLESLVNLEELYMEDSFDQWEAEDKTPRSNASLAEFKNMNKLRNLSIAIPRSANLSRDLPFGKLNKHKILIGDIWDWSDKYNESRTLKLKLDSGNLLSEEWVRRCLQRTEYLNLTGLQDNHSIHNLCFEGFQELKHLHIQNSPSLQYVVHSTEDIRCTTFMRLESLFLENLNNLEKICCSRLALESFSKLKILKMVSCSGIKYLFPYSMIRNFLQLEEIEISNCHLIKHIVANAEADEDGDEMDVDPKVKSCNLRRLTLRNLPEMKSFCKTMDHSVVLFDKQQVKFPNLESMEISHMNNLEKIWLDDLASNAFSKLKTLVVKNCEKLSFIFSSYTMLTRFQNLEKISVTNCGSLEVVFHIQEFYFSEACPTSTFQLEELVLTRLPKMKHVWSGHPRGGLTFGRLRCMEIVECERLKSLFPSSVAKSMTQLEELLVRECGVQEIIVEDDGVEMNARDLFFPQLTDLKLLELLNLRSFYRNSHTSTWPLLKKLRVRHYGKMRSFSFACEYQSCRGTSTSENQPALFSFEKVIPNLKGLTLTSEDVIMMTRQHHYVFHNLTELDLACYHDENVTFPSDFLLHRFPDLKELSLSCSSFEEIFPEDACGHGGATSYGELTNMETPLKALKNLQRLELNKLCKLQRVWKDGSLMAEILKQIETLLVSECSSLSIVLPSPNAFQRLTKLEVKDCAGLVHMGTSSAATSLVNLAWLTLRNCGAMEDVVTDDGTGVEEISFPKLWRLTLDGLPSLESFSSVNCTFMFPSLWRIIVKQCPKMNIFCNGALSTPTLRQVRLSDEDYEGRWEGDLNTTIQFLLT